MSCIEFWRVKDTCLYINGLRLEIAEEAFYLKKGTQDTGFLVGVQPSGQDHSCYVTILPISGLIKLLVAVCNDYNLIVEHL